MLQYDIGEQVALTCFNLLTSHEFLHARQIARASFMVVSPFLVDKLLSRRCGKIILDSTIRTVDVDAAARQLSGLTHPFGFS